MNRNPLNLPLKEPDERCNARTIRGYCKNKSGWKTPHIGTGRCWLHGGLTPSVQRKKNGDFSVQTLYTKMLPTSLAEELVEIKHDPMFSNLFNEYAVLKMIVQGLLYNLPVDITLIYGKPICSRCKKKYKQTGEKFFLEYKNEWSGDQKRLDKIVSTIESMSRVFEKISKHEERQQKYILISELEQLMVRWGKILMKYLGDDPRIYEIQQEIMNLGFVRRPGDDDQEKLKMFREIQSKARNYKTNSKSAGRDVTVGEAIEHIYPEFFEEADVIDEKPKKRKHLSKKKKAVDAKKLLKKKKVIDAKKLLKKKG